jgi:hypothetical protein
MVLESNTPPDAPFVLVARVGRLNRVGAGPHFQNKVHNRLERRVGSMGHMPAPKADVIADAVFRNAGQRMVQRFDAQLGPFAVAFRTLLGQVIEHVGQHGVIHLQ